MLHKTDGPRGKAETALALGVGLMIDCPLPLLSRSERGGGIFLVVAAFLVGGASTY